MNLQGILLGVVTLLMGLGGAAVQTGKVWEGLGMIVVGLAAVWLREHLKE
jgi:ABC-type uncharacterized transport system permease subunit